MLKDQYAEDQFDVVIVGGGSAGVAAAIGAAKLGNKVALIEKYGFLGGAATMSSVQAYCGFYSQKQEQVVSGVGAEVLDLLSKKGFTETRTQQRSGNTIVIFNPEDLKVTLDSIITNFDITLFLHCTVFSLQSDGNKINSISFAHRGGITKIKARQFIDTSGDGVLIQHSEAAHYKSSPEERQGNTLVMQVSGVAKEASLNPRTLDTAVQKYSGVKDPIQNNVAVRVDNTGAIMLLMANERFDVFDARSTTRAEMSARAKAHAFLKALKNVKGWENAYLSNTGPQIGIRESLRLQGKQTVTKDFIQNATKLPESAIARCGWPIEDHSSPGNTQYIPIKNKDWFHIPLGALQSLTFENLWAGGRLISADNKAYTSIRVMGTAFATGHAAGVGAGLSAQSELAEVNTKTVQKELRKQGAII